MADLERATPATAIAATTPNAAPTAVVTTTASASATTIRRIGLPRWPWPAVGELGGELR